jgi:hypothetical protein
VKNCEVYATESGITARFPAGDAAIPEAVKSADRRLDQFAKEPLTTKMVEEILDITSRERLRWTRDGRLPGAGTASFKHGQNHLHSLQYSPVVISDLEKQELTGEWRKAIPPWKLERFSPPPGPSPKFFEYRVNRPLTLRGEYYQI